MQVSNNPTPDANAAGSPAPSAASSAFSDILSSVAGSTASGHQDDSGKPAAPSDNQQAGSGNSDPIARSGLAVPAEPKITKTQTAPIKQNAVGARQQGASVPAQAGADADVAHEKVWKSPDELVNFAETAGTKAAADPALVQAGIVPDKSATDKPAVKGKDRRSGDASSKQPAKGPGFESASATMLQPLPSPQVTAAAKVQPLADPSWAHEKEAASTVAGPVEAPQGKISGQASFAPANSSPTSMPALVQASGSALVPLSMPMLVPAVNATPPQIYREKSVQLPGDAISPTGSLGHAAKTLHTLDVLDDAGEKANIEVVQGEIVEEPQPVAQPASAPTDAGAKTSARASGERLLGPANLGKPAFAMATQGSLQVSVNDRQDAASPAAFGLAAQEPGAAAIVSAGTTHQAPAPQALPLVQHVVLPTSLKQLAPDLGNEVVRSIGAGKNEVAIRLDPANLGRVDIHMSFGDDGRMRAVIAADNPTTFHMLKQDASVLARTLSDAGVKTDASDLRFDMRQGGQQRDGQPSSHYGSAGDDRQREDLASEEATETRSTRGRLV